MEKSKLNLRRFKNNQAGLTSFTKLLEQAAPEKRSWILAKVKETDADFFTKVLSKMLPFEEMMHLDEGTLAEIIGQIPAKLMAYALYGAQAELRKKFLSQVDFKQSRLMKDEEERFNQGIPKHLVLGAQKQILKIARRLEAQGKIVLDLTPEPAAKP